MDAFSGPDSGLIEIYRMKDRAELRCFIAIRIPDEVKNRINSLIEPLRAAANDVKWVRAENLHITLKFLGSTEESKIPSMADALRKLLCHYRTFYITIAATGCFPSERRPKVIWVGLSDHETLVSLQRDIDGLMKNYGYSPEQRAFLPHVTIGRVKPPGKLRTAAGAIAENSQRTFGSFPVSCLHLMKSDLTPAGAVYTQLAEIPFGEEEDQ